MGWPLSSRSSAAAGAQPAVGAVLVEEAVLQGGLAPAVVPSLPHAPGGRPVQASLIRMHPLLVALRSHGDDLLGAEAQDALGRGAHVGVGTAAQVGGVDQVAGVLQDGAQIRLSLAQVLQGPPVRQPDGQAAGEALQKGHLLDGEQARPAVVEVENADHLRVRPHRQDGDGLVALLASQTALNGSFVVRQQLAEVVRPEPAMVRPAGLCGRRAGRTGCARRRSPSPRARCRPPAGRPAGR